VPGLPSGMTKEEVEQAIAARLETVEIQMSTWRETSDVSRFNRSTETGIWFAVARATADVVIEAKRIFDETGGAFDPTVHPLVALWGFGAAGKPRDTIPTDAEILEARSRTGFDAIEVRRDPPALRKDRPDLTLDLSAIAKGWGVDQVFELLRGLGVASCFVEVGGEVRVAGTRPDGSPWRVGIEVPKESSERRPYTVLPLSEGAVATSGGYRSFVDIAGERFSHTIDPRDGRPVRHALGSVTVVTDTCTEADALATALLVLGPDEGYTFAEKHGLRALFLVRQGEEIVERRTPNMPETQPV